MNNKGETLNMIIKSLRETVVLWGLSFMVFFAFAVFFITIFNTSKVLGIVATVIFLSNWYEKYSDIKD